MSLVAKNKLTLWLDGMCAIGKAEASATINHYRNYL